MKIRTILDQIDLGAMALPEFQRGYVWNRDQVRKLMSSLYRKHPVGSLLVWVTRTEQANTRGDGTLTPGSVKLILDGQQRITSLYGIIRGHQPKFFEGDAYAFSGLYFNLEDEVFEYYAPLKMKDNPLWIDVTNLMKSGAGELIGLIAQNPDLISNLNKYINRLNSIDNIKEIDLHIEEVTGEDKTIDVVVDIFNNVNSGGTKLSKGDLALAKVCAEWSDARAEMKTRLNKWKQAGYNFKLEWLMRCVNAIVTGESLFSHLSDVEVEEFKTGLNKAEKSIDFFLNLISSRLGLDHDRVLGSRYSFPLLARYLELRGGKLTDARERDKLLYWYIHTFLWGRYAGSTESVLSQDLRAIQDAENPLDRLISLLSQNRGDLRIRESDFFGWSIGARFYPLLYMLTRTGHSKDWNTGLELSSHLLGRLNRLEIHHIFPKALLYKHGYERQDVNALANFTFLTQETNLYVTDKNPAEYLEEFAAKNPGAVESHWIPMDRNLWKIENYHEFLTARRELLAEAANKFLDGLLIGSIPEHEISASVLQQSEPQNVGGTVSKDEEELLIEYNEWIIQKGLPEGEFLYEVIDENSGQVTAIIDLAWANGLQEGYSQPVALLIDEDKATEEAVNRAGFRFFTDFEDFKKYVKNEILAEEIAGIPPKPLATENALILGENTTDTQQTTVLKSIGERQILDHKKPDTNTSDHYHIFWENLLSLAREKSHLHDYISPSARDFICIKNVRGLKFNYVIKHFEGRVELYIDRGKIELNKKTFDELLEHKNEIETTFGEPLFWQRLDEKITSRISYKTNGGIKNSHLEWIELHTTMIDAMIRLEKAISPFLVELLQ